MVRPLIVNSHLDESRVDVAVRTLVNDFPLLAGRLCRDPATAEYAILCHNRVEDAGSAARWASVGVASVARMAS
jgi:hypothetical protein